MAFLRLKHAYAQVKSAIRTNLPLRQAAGRLGPRGLMATATNDRLSRTLAGEGLRHRLEHSRPLALGVASVRCITSYDDRWNEAGFAPAGEFNAAIETFEEPVPGLAA